MLKKEENNNFTIINMNNTSDTATIIKFMDVDKGDVDEKTEQKKISMCNYINSKINIMNDVLENIAECKPYSDEKKVQIYNFLRYLLFVTLLSLLTCTMLIVNFFFVTDIINSIFGLFSIKINVYLMIMTFGLGIGFISILIFSLFNSFLPPEKRKLHILILILIFGTIIPVAWLIYRHDLCGFKGGLDIQKCFPYPEEWIRLLK